MGKYSLIISVKAKEEISCLYKLGDKSIIRKLDRILQELMDHPKTGTGKVEQLRGDLVGCWSRRLNKQHRIVYEIKDDIVTVLVLSVRGHYGD
jgi:toxin YoeB